MAMLAQIKMLQFWFYSFFKDYRWFHSEWRRQLHMREESKNFQSGNAGQDFGSF